MGRTFSFLLLFTFGFFDIIRTIFDSIRSQRTSWIRHLSVIVYCQDCHLPISHDLASQVSSSFILWRHLSVTMNCPHNVSNNSLLTIYLFRFNWHCVHVSTFMKSFEGWNQYITRMHSSRSHTARLLTVSHSNRWGRGLPLDADPSGCTPLWMHTPLDADHPGYVTFDACWEAKPLPAPPGQTEWHTLCER